MERGIGFAWVGVVLVVSGCEPDIPLPPDGDGLPSLTVGGNAANYSCTPTAPVPGSEIALTAQLQDDATNAPGANHAVDVFPGGVIADTCAGTCFTVMTDGGGKASITIPSGMFAYRVPASDDVLVSAGYRIARPTDLTKRFAFLTAITANDTATALGRSVVAGTSAIGGTIYDCDDQPVAGATIKLFVDGIEIASGPAATDPFVAYFNRVLPQPGATTTDAAGWYGAGNMPVGRLRVEVYGKKTPNGSLELVACEEGRVFGDGYTTMPLRPLRSDYAMDSGCRP